MKREPISLSVRVYELTEAGGIRSKPRPSVDLSFGPDGRPKIAQKFRKNCLARKLKIPNLCGLLKQPQSIVGGECLFNSSCYVYENNRLENYCEQEGQCSVDAANQETEL